MLTAHDFHLPITTEEDLREFVRLAWGATIPDVQVCDEHSTPWRAFCDAYFARSPVTVWKASRGFGGKSFLLALLGLTEAVTLKANVNVLGGSGEQSGRVLEHAQQFWDHDGAPTDLLVGDVKRETRLTWGNRIQALMASQRSVRGPHPQRLRLDEIDEMALAILDAAMGQPMEADTGIAAQTVMSSTHQYADGTMTEILQRANEKGWLVSEWCYKETSAAPTGWLKQSEIERKQQEVTTTMWNVEFDLQEASPESRAIQSVAVEAMFRRDLGTWRGSNQEYIEIEAPVVICQECGYKQPEGKRCVECNAETRDARYATGADWAKKQDWTVIPTLCFDYEPARIVAFERCGRLPWPVMVEKFDRRLERYRGGGAHDGTGLGDVVNDLLTKRAKSVVMVGRARSDLLSNYISAIERGELESPMIEFMYNEHKYASVDDVYGSGHLPDSIAAGALAWSARKRGVFVG